MSIRKDATRVIGFNWFTNCRRGQLTDGKQPVHRIRTSIIGIAVCATTNILRAQSKTRKANLDENRTKRHTPKDGVFGGPKEFFAPLIENEKCSVDGATIDESELIIYPSTRMRPDLMPALKIYLNPEGTLRAHPFHVRTRQIAISNRRTARRKP